MNLIVYFLSTLCLVRFSQGAYQIVEERLSKDDAEEYCAVNYPQGKLATIDTDARNTEVAQMCNPVPTKKGTGTGCYIGVLLESGSFVDGTAITYNSETGEWNVALGTFERPFICEFAIPSLLPDKTLVVTDYLLSDNQRFFASVQGDGNFAIYDTQSGLATWSTGTADGNFERFLILQGDGNIVLYNNDLSVAWAAYAFAEPTQLILQDDGNLVAYATNGASYWHTGTVAALKNGQFSLALSNISHDLRLRQQLKMVAIAAAVTLVLLVAYFWRKRVTKQTDGVYQPILSYA